MITASGLQFTYPKSAAPALKGMSFDIERGEIFGFLGPSGAGKSTTQKILIGLLRSYHGAVAVLGKPLAEWGSDYYERIGVSFEFPNHYLKLTARENLGYFGSLYNRPTRLPQVLLEMVGLGEDGDMPVSQYSKGMKNRLSVARALLHDPDLIFLDEPTAGLDPVNAQRVKELVRDQKQAGKTVFLTTHDMMVADGLCDRVAFIVDGQIELVDAPRELKLRYGKPAVRVEYALDGHTEQREFKLEGLGDNVEFADTLRRYPIQTIHSQEASLEDVFIQVTGRRLA
jgi:fluoroquinolone transport system ATP-binding protein